jgi:signal transduction histidine kinase
MIILKNHFLLLLERIKIHFRNKNENKVLTLGNIVLDKNTFQVFVDKKEVNLTQREFELLAYLIKNKGHVCTRTNIIEDVWDIHFELRTPLAVIKGTMEVLIRKPRNEDEYKEKIRFCINEIDRLNTMVDQLLLLARFENQKQNVKLESINLNALILDNLARFSEKSKIKKLKIKTKFINDFYIQLDSYLVSIIISNLISNALKYSNDMGEVILQLYRQHNEIIFTIEDYGVGISEQNLNKIFNSFYRSDVSFHPEIKGTGLGLSIVKRLSDLLNIKILVESKLNQGTKFRVVFKD